MKPIRSLAVASMALLLAASAAAQGTMTWTYGYDAEGNRTIAVDPNGFQSTFSYDTLQRRTSIVLPPPSTGVAAPRIGIGYDLANNVASVLDPRSLSTTFASDAFANVWTRRSPDSGQTTSTFDAAGNVTSQTDARGKTTTYTYDALNRLRTVSYASGVATTYEYDGGSSPYPGSIGKLTRMTDESGVTTFGYDSLGRLTSRVQSIDGASIAMLYAWGASGPSTNRVVSVTYPSGAVIGYGYDAAGRVASISASGMTVLSGVTYNGDNNITGWRWGNGVAVERTYDLFGRLTSYPIGNLTRTVTYDAAGRITGLTQSDNSNNQAFVYDGNDRLIQQTIPSLSYAYAYDATGNRTAYRVGSVTLINAVSPFSNQFTSVQRLVGTQVVAYAQAYDAAGALVADGGQMSVYSDRGRRATTTSGAITAYRYNGFDERIAKSGPAVPSGAAYYSYDPASRPVGEYDASLNVISETVYLGSTPVAALKQVGLRSGQTVQLSVNHVYADQIDTPRVVTTNSNGAILWRWDVAEAFGNTAPQENPPGQGTFAYNQRMPGQTYDAESGLVYNIHREYRPATGAYIQSDPIGLSGGPNLFAYAGANPVSYVDPKGLAYFAYRPLLGLNFMILNPLLGRVNWQVAHENLFFEDGGVPSNLGFFAERGVASDAFPFGYGPPSSAHYNDCVMREIVQLFMWGPESYTFFCSNCQKWGTEVKIAYELFKNTKAVQNKCGCVK